MHSQREAVAKPLRIAGSNTCHVLETWESANWLAERTRQLEAVRTIATEIARQLDLSTLLPLLARRAAALVGATAGSVFLWDAARETLRPAACDGPAIGIGETATRLEEGIAGVVAARREGLLIHEVRTSPYAAFSPLANPGITAALGEPLLYEERLLAVVLLTMQGDGRDFTVQDQEALRLLAPHAAIAIQNARQFGQLTQSVQEFRQAQAASVRSETFRSLGQMAAGVAHDLNNILAVVLAQSELLDLQVRDPLVQKSLRVFETAAADGAHLVRRLQDFARLRVPPARWDTGSTGGLGGGDV